MSTSIDTLSLIQLRCFVTVIDTGSFAAAARKLTMTTSGVSKTISRLEASYNVRLLHRSTHSVSPTEAGERLIELARAVLFNSAGIDALLTDAGKNDAVGNVRLSASPAFVRHCIAPLLPALRERHPEIVLDLRASDITFDLADTGLDLVFRSGTFEGLPGHVRLPWFDFDWITCASPDYLKKNGIPETPHDLTAFSLIGFRNARTGLVEHWRLRDGSFPSAPVWSLVSDDAETVLLAAESGSGIMWAPQWLVADAITTGRVTEILAEWRGERMPMSILRRGQKLLPSRVRAVIDFFSAHGTNLARS